MQQGFQGLLAEIAEMPAIQGFQRFLKLIHNRSIIERAQYPHEQAVRFH
jgi:hypothetical protein